MEFHHLSDLELFKILVGERTAERAFTGSVLRLFLGEPPVTEVHPRIGAAKELVRRALQEDLRQNSALQSPAAVRDFLRLTLSGREHEAFVVICVDSQHRVINVEEIFRGTLAQTSVYPREIVKHALRANAAAVIFAHNHPSGVAQPSQADELLTRQLKEALALVDVKVLDHFIVAGNQALSFAERGLL